MAPQLLVVLLIILIIGFLIVGLVWGLPLLRGDRQIGLGGASSLTGGSPLAGSGQSGFPDTRAEPKEVKTSELTLEKRLKYARWSVPIPLFRGLSILISLVACFLISQKFNLILTIAALWVGPLVMNGALNFSMKRRSKQFTRDYAAFLMSLTSLLKTGMNTMTALASAADALDEDSLVREEVMLMLERLKFGVDEDRSIGSFAEDIYHPEIELFVQALLLSRRVGGSLADTLDRLSRQVRKREQFRASANAAVGMQRGSIWFIIGIMVFIELYLYWFYPQAIIDSIADDFGWQIWQVGILLILIGIKWVRVVTEFRI